jgi:ADP-ribose pyrophosphatase YjhB (NUDIX family)
MELSKIINCLEKSIEDPTKGLPEEVFLLLSRITPLINVDLLINNERNQTLLTWRDDGYYPAGWHIPGGIIRYKETAAERISAVALGELGATVEYPSTPLALNEIIHPSRKDRGHFISLIYRCSLTSHLDENIKFLGGKPRHREWAWHDKCPEDIISVHEIYRKYF